MLDRLCQGSIVERGIETIKTSKGHTLGSTVIRTSACTPDAHEASERRGAGVNQQTYPEGTAGPPSRTILSHPLKLQRSGILLEDESRLVSYGAPVGNVKNED